MSFQCSKCKATFSHKHHLTNHLNKKKKCINSDIHGKVFTLTINGNHYEVSNTSEVDLTDKIIEFIGKSNIKKISVPVEKEQEKPFIIPLIDGVEDTRTDLEKQIDLDNKRNDYIDKVKKYFHRRAINLLKKTSNKLNPTMSIKAISENKKLLNYELKKASQLVRIPDEYTYTEEQKIKIERVEDKTTLEKLINKSMNLHDEIVDMEYKQFNLPDIEGEYEIDNELENKRNMLCDIKRTLKLSGVDLTGIQYTPSKIIK